MMRKLAVTVFVVSLAALGCGSDSGNPTKNDTGVPADGAKPTDVANKDVAGSDIAIGGPDVSIDVAQGAETGPKLDVAVLTETGALETNPQLDSGKDTSKLDSQSIDIVPSIVDGGADTKTSEAGTAVDTGTSVDGGTAG
jgi:hypothetical protein